MEELEIRILFDLTKSLAGDYLKGFTYPWEALSGIGEMIVALGKTLPEAEYNKCGENIWVAKDAIVAPSACINGPAIIGRQYRQGSRGAPLCLYPGECFSRCESRGRKFDGIKKCNSF